MSIKQKVLGRFLHQVITLLMHQQERLYLTYSRSPSATAYLNIRRWASGVLTLIQKRVGGTETKGKHTLSRYDKALMAATIGIWVDVCLWIYENVIGIPRNLNAMLSSFSFYLIMTVMFVGSWLVYKLYAILKKQFPEKAARGKET